jgi:hypothetical protein
MKERGLTYFMLLVFALSSGCGKSKINTTGDYLKWLSDEEHGLVKTKYVNGMEIKVKYMPPEYMASQEMQSGHSYSLKQTDSLLNLYKNSMNILFSIGPDERKETGADVMFQSVKTYQEYAERVNDFNFQMEEYVTLQAGDEKFRPVLSAMENVYGLKASRDILFVFVPKDISDHSMTNSDKLDFLYEDGLFDLGDNHFVFLKKDIEKIPVLDLSKLNR